MPHLQSGGHQQLLSCQSLPIPQASSTQPIPSPKTLLDAPLQWSLVPGPPATSLSSLPSCIHTHWEFPEHSRLFYTCVQGKALFLLPSSFTISQTPIHLSDLLPGGWGGVPCSLKPPRPSSLGSAPSLPLLHQFCGANSGTGVAMMCKTLA